MTTTTQNESTFINDAKKRNARINKLFTVFTKFYQGNGRTEQEKSSAKENIFSGICSVTHCKRFGNCDNTLVQCKACKGKTATTAKIKEMCEVFSAENVKAKAKAKKEKSAKKPVDKYGFRLDSKIHKVVELLSKRPLKMTDLKKATGDSYYNVAKRRTDVFACTENGYWYILNTHSATLAIEIEAQLKAEKEILAEIKKMSDNF